MKRQSRSSKHKIGVIGTINRDTIYRADGSAVPSSPQVNPQVTGSDGYYAFFDVGPWMDRAGMADSAAMGAYLAERFGLAVVPGVYFSDFGARWVRYRQWVSQGQ